MEEFRKKAGSKKSSLAHVWKEWGYGPNKLVTICGTYEVADYGDLQEPDDNDQRCITCVQRIIPMPTIQQFLLQNGAKR